MIAIDVAARSAPAPAPGPARVIRVLHLRDSPWVDGPGRTVLETGSHVDPARIEYHIGAFVAPGADSHPLIEAAEARGLSTHRIADCRGVPRELVDRVVQLIDTLRIDVLHTSEFRSNVLALLCRRRRNVRLVSTAHGWIANDLRGRIYRFADKLILPRFDAVILVSQAMRRLVPRWWLPDSRAQVLLNGLVLAAYGRDVLNQPRRRLDAARGAVLLNVGRLSPEKGQDLLLRAVAELSAEYPRLRLQFAGIGPMEQQLRELAASLDLADRVEFLGYVADMPRLYGGIDLVVQSSLTEGLPNVILEAAFLRVPIVATTAGGTAEVIEHGRSGWLIPTGSVRALGTGIREYLRRPQDFAAMGDAAHEGILTRFSFEVRTQRLMEIYERLAGANA